MRSVKKNATPKAKNNNVGATSYNAKLKTNPKGRTTKLYPIKLIRAVLYVTKR